MYQCKFFYVPDKKPLNGADTVVAAWEITADDKYSFDMSEDAMQQKNMYCFIRTVSGEGVLETVDGSVTLSLGDYIVLPREDIQKYFSQSKIWSYYWVDFLLYSGDFSNVGRKRHAEHTEHEQRLFRELLETGIKFPYETQYINSIFNHYYLYMCFSDDGSAEKRPTLLFSDISSYIGQKLYGKITVQELADFFGISTRRVHQIFRENINTSPKQYISQQKMKKAEELLIKTSSTVADIAAILGYDSAYHFSSAFKKSHDMSPSIYRKNNMIL